MLKNYAFLILTLLGFSQYSSAQVFNAQKGCVVDSNNECVPNTQATSMPFLRIAPDARSGSMGDVGLTTKADASSIAFNASNLVFAEDNSEMAFTFTPWLRDLNLDDVYLFYGSAFTKIDEAQAIGVGLRYFSLGDIPFRDETGTETQKGMPRDFSISATYARKLGSNLSAGLTAKYLYSNLATGQNIGGIELVSARAFAADISVTYKKPMKIASTKGDLVVGMAVTNIGPKVTYRNNSDERDFIPTNLGLGVGYHMDIDEYNYLGVSLEFNKLLVPSLITEKIYDADGKEIDNPEYDKDKDDVADFRQKTLISGIFGSFSDAQGGFSEEIKEISIGFGLEYWYNKQFAARAGYYHENKLKGNRKYFTLGIGIKYNVFGINLAYLAPATNQRSPLDNTLRFSLLVDLDGTQDLNDATD